MRAGRPAILNPVYLTSIFYEVCKLHTFFSALNGILEVHSKDKTGLSVRERGGRTAVGEGGVQEWSVR